MKFLKKNKIAIISITLMLVVAGYINYEYNPQREKNLGQTIYVNGKDSAEVDTVGIYNDETESNSNKNLYEYSTSKESTIAVFKYDRDNMFSELSENYREIISNTNTTADKVNEYQIKLNGLLEKKNLITMVENIIKSKEITKEQIAQIKQLLVDQFGISANKITITVSENDT